MVKRCPACGYKKTRVLDVLHVAKLNIVLRTHRCLGAKCQKIIVTEERVIAKNRPGYTLR